MQPLARVADGRDQARLDIHVHVFEIDAPSKGAGRDLGRNHRHAAFDFSQVLRGNNALLGEHLRVRERTLNIDRGHALVEGDRRRKSFHQFGNRLGKSPGKVPGRRTS